MTLRAILFDVDGTLAETEECHRRAFNRAFAEAGLDWCWDETLYADLLRVAGGKERMAHYAGTVGNALDDDRIAAIHQRKTDIYAAMVTAGDLRLRPGVADVIRAAPHAGVRLGIATTTSRPNIDALLTSTLGAGAIDRFAAIACGDSVAEKKPAPDVYQLALRQIDLDARQCIAIEDSENGLRAAVGAGIATAVTRGIYLRDGDFSRAVTVIDSLTALGSDGETIIAALDRLTAQSNASD